MLNGITWKDYFCGIGLLLIVYYGGVSWVYRKELLQWWRKRKEQ